MHCAQTELPGVDFNDHLLGDPHCLVHAQRPAPGPAQPVSASLNRHFKSGDASDRAIKECQFATCSAPAKREGVPQSQRVTEIFHPIIELHRRETAINRVHLSRLAQAQAPE